MTSTMRCTEPEPWSFLIEIVPAPDTGSVTMALLARVCPVLKLMVLVPGSGEPPG